MEKKLKKIPYVKVCIDDILVTGRNDVEHVDNLDKVFNIIQDASLHLKLSKCMFMKPGVIYLGHRINSTGIAPVKDTICAIKEPMPPASVTELRAFLGLIIYHRYLPTTILQY